MAARLLVQSSWDGYGQNFSDGEKFSQLLSSSSASCRSYTAELRNMVEEKQTLLLHSQKNDDEQFPLCKSDWFFIWYW